MRRFLTILLVGLSLPVAVIAASADKKADPGLNGDWSTVSFLRAGAPLPKEKQFPGRIMTIKEGKFSEVRDGKIAVSGPLEIDSTKSPKWMDATFELGGPGPDEKVLGIYELDGDNLKVCCGAAGDPRPTKFESPDGSHLRLIIYKRHKPSAAGANP